MKNFKVGQHIRVSCEVKYGEIYFCVACHGVIKDNKRGKYLQYRRKKAHCVSCGMNCVIAFLSNIWYN